MEEFDAFIYMESVDLFCFMVFSPSQSIYLKVLINGFWISDIYWNDK